MANEIPISVVDRKIKVGRHVPATMTNIGKDYISISLDNEWSSTNHRLRVTLYSEAPYVSVQNWWDGKSAIEIPQEITSCPTFKVTVALLSEDGHERLVTQAMDEPIENPRNGHDEGAEPGVRTMDIIARIDNLAADLEEKRDTDYWRGEPGKDGAPGAPGEPGADGYSPTANVTKVGGTATITITDKNGTTTATVSDGAPGKDGSDAAATEVRIAGKSITAAGVADIKLWEYGGLVYGEAGLETVPASEASISARGGSHYLIPADSRLDYAVKAAMCDGKGAAWTADEQKAARKRMNAADANRVYIMQKQIENLQGIAATEETDSTEAYTKTIPTGAQKWASLDKVGGNTVVWNQLEGLEISILNYPAWDMSNNTVTDGVLSGHLTGNYGGWNNRVDDRTPLTVGHKYLFLVDANFPVGIDMNVRIGGEGSTSKKYGGTGAFQTMSVMQTAADGMTKWFLVQSSGFSDYDVQIKNPQIFDLTQMFGAGNEPSTVEEFRAMFPADYYPYNPGELMSAEVVEVESRGKNLLDPSLLVFNRGVDSGNGNVYQTTSNNWYATEEYIDVRLLAGSNITFSGFLSTKATTAAFYDINKTFISSASFDSGNMTRTVPSNAAYMRYDCHKSNVDGGMLQLERGTTATTYSPYGIKGTFQIPAEVRNLCPGYGWSAGTVCNEIDFERKKYVQRVASVDLGTLSYWNGSTDVSGKYRFGSDNVKDIKPITQNVFTKDLRYSANTYNYVDGIEVSTQGVIYICDSRYETAVDFKSAMAGVMLYYELAEPIEVDLSNVLPDDHYIEVEAGGTVTFKQASTQLPVPSSVTYQISTSEVIANA